MALPSSAPLGYAQASLTVVQLLSALLAVPSGATYVVLIPETNGLRWRDDGTNPTAAIGMPVAAGQSFVYDGDLSKLRVVSQAATCTLNLAYFAARHP